jgi:hypothetical protein
VGGQAALVYSTYLGGTNYDEITTLTVSAGGEAYLTGRTSSGDFPLQDPVLVRSYVRDSTIFATKLDPSGSSLEYSTLVGGTGFEAPGGAVLDGAGDLVIAGGTYSHNFPTTPNAAVPADPKVEAYDLRRLPGHTFFTKIGERQGGRIVPPSAPVVAADRKKKGLPGALVTFATPTLDGASPGTRLEATHASGDYFPEGTTLVQFTALDGTAIASVHWLPVKVTVPWGVCVGNDVSAEYFSIVLDKASPYYGYWRYDYFRFADGNAGLTGVANTVKFNPERVLKVLDTDDPKYRLSVKLNYRGDDGRVKLKGKKGLDIDFSPIGLQGVACP